MPINLELKIKVDNHRKIISRLIKAGAQNKGILKQKDIYYKVKSGLLKLRIQESAYVLIKYLRDEKGKRFSNYELMILQGKNPEKYLAGIFDVEAVVEKNRKLFLFENTRIHLDDIKGLGKFLELETLLISTKNDAHRRFNEVVKMLNLDLTKQIKASYKNLMMNK